ncbi:hypothetical protein Q428_00830 [Fervidicella metallireducens AeB]|uniref:Thymidylate synthase n=1 Tax=Fervidicella metallireducens AeB TaxID=1403537 RepID=A0A017RYZ2_9CLOT|nr:YigZ family protein [Fervidicella metallireducens]EYE89604.1 hypothetical protein Q428_00830 [Fervidicella metallireducens AeB]
MSKDNYTILKQVEVSFEEKKSVFICNIKRISDEKEAMDFIGEIKSKYKDARHNVYAYITNNGISMRYSDDGEPQGTAGPPVLEVLRRENLNDVAVVVTRYFGGILLGAGGLVRAYSASCKQGIDAGVKVRREEGCSFEINLDYDMYGKMTNYLQKKNILIKNTEFLESIKMEIICLKSDFEDIKCDIMEMMNGKNIIELREEFLCFVDDEGMLMEV